jgi:hypothetical protein
MTEAIEAFIKGVKEKHDNLETLKVDKYSFGPWSISKLKCLQKCPFQFYLKYILKIKVPEDVMGKQDSMSADVGSAGHRILELVVIGKTIEASYAAAKKEFVPSKLTEEQWKEHVETLEMSIIAFQERIQKLERNYKVKRLFTELRLGVTKDWEPTGFFADNVYFRGIIDLVIQLDNLDIIILDHKTGGGEGSIKVYEEQLNSYKPLFHYGKEKVNGAQAGVHFIRASDVKMGFFSSKEDVQKKLVTELEWSLEGAVETVKELGYMKHIRGNQCKWCEYNEACKPGMLKEIEKDTKRFFKGIPIVTEIQNQSALEENPQAGS